jgi:predicted NACHT family NTPase
LLTVGMLPDAYDLLKLMKQQIDGLLAGDEKLQQFLGWVHQKAVDKEVDAPYKSAAIHAFYFDLDLVYDRVRAITRSHAPTRDLDLRDFGLIIHYDLIRDRDLALACDLDRALGCDLFFSNYHKMLSEVFAHDLAVDLDLDCDLALDQSLTMALALACACALAFPCNINLDRTPDLNHIHTHDPELKLKLEELAVQLPNSASYSATKKQWWQNQGQAWIEQLRTVMIEHRNIGHDWQLSEAQAQRLQQYYEANQLLVAGLNSDCYVSRAVREEIEATLLLPLAEIERRRTV